MKKIFMTWKFKILVLLTIPLGYLCILGNSIEWFFMREKIGINISVELRGFLRKPGYDDIAHGLEYFTGSDELANFIGSTFDFIILAFICLVALLIMLKIEQKYLKKES